MANYGGSDLKRFGSCNPALNEWTKFLQETWDKRNLEARMEVYDK